MTETIEIPALFDHTINLASPRLGSQTVRATDEFFAAKERMLLDAAPVFIEDKFDTHGKWMDGWESRRRRDGGHDWCLIKLGLHGRIRGVDIDTSHFTGNYPPAASIDACLSADEPDETTQWQEIIPAATLGPSAHHFLEAVDRGPWNWLRLNLYPDGGVARLRVYGNAAPDWVSADLTSLHELSGLKNGGRVIAYNDAHYGEVWALLSEGRGLNMGDGWETRRRREPGNDWLIVKLGALGTVERIEVDTANFKGNFPDRFSVQAANVTTGTDQSVVIQSMFWHTLIGEQPLTADAIHSFKGADIKALGPISHVRLNIFPDGGISRFRVFGRLTPENAVDGA